MKRLIRTVLKEYVNESHLITEMARLDWCTDFKKFEPEYPFCRAAENYIKNELEDSPSIRGKRKGKLVFKEFEQGLQKFFDTVKDDTEISKKIIQIDTSSPIYKEGKEELERAIKLLEPNCTNIRKVADRKLKDFEDRVKLYFIDNEKYSNNNRLPTNYSALAVLFTKFFSNKGAFDGVSDTNLKWDEIAKNWITHSFHPYQEFMDIRPDTEKEYDLTDMSFGELARIYFTNDTVFNSEDIRSSVKKVLDGVRGKGFESEDQFEKMYLDNKRNAIRFARDYGFVDMFTGVDFIYESKNGMWIPVQVKTTATEPTYLISTLGCRHYVIAEKLGQKFKMDTYPKEEDLPN